MLVKGAIVPNHNKTDHVHISLIVAEQQYINAHTATNMNYVTEYQEYITNAVNIDHIIYPSYYNRNPLCKFKFVKQKI